MKALTIIEHDGHKYWEEDVTKDKKSVGRSATMIPEPYNHIGAVEMYGSQQILDLAMAQLRTNHRNSVRGGKGSKLTAEDVFTLVSNGTLIMSEVQRNAATLLSNNPTEKYAFTKAAAAMLIPEDSDGKTTFFAPVKIDEPEELE